MKMVYIASPYTIGDRYSNVNFQIKIANELMNYGFCPVVPLLSHFQEAIYPREYSEWMTIDKEKISRCDGLLRVGGYSEGANMEVKFAEENGIPVYYSVQDVRFQLR